MSELHDAIAEGYEAVATGATVKALVEEENAAHQLIKELEGQRDSAHSELAKVAAQRDNADAQLTEAVALITKIEAQRDAAIRNADAAIGNVLRAMENWQREQAKNAELEAQLAEAKDEAKEHEAARLTHYELWREAYPRAARLEAALKAVEEYMASEEGPLYRLWENTDIGDYDDTTTDWEQTLFDLRDWKNGCVPAASLGYGTEWPEVVLYRQVLAALAPEPAANEHAERGEREGNGSH